MSTFFMFGKYSSEALKKISAKRTDEAVNLIKKMGGKVEAMYALIGEKDFIV
ncbi:MAG: GYD domain-containing protein [bacterium]